MFNCFIALAYESMANAMFDRHLIYFSHTFWSRSGDGSMNVKGSGDLGGVLVALNHSHNNHTDIKNSPLGFNCAVPITALNYSLKMHDSNYHA